jgi:hypothetical protein
MFTIYAAPVTTVAVYDQTTESWHVESTVGSFTEIHGSNTAKVSDYSLKLARDAIDCLTFNIYYGNPMYHKMEPLRTLIKVVDGSTVKFYGRVCGVEPQMNDDGLPYKSVTCESCKAFMLDTAVELDSNAYYRDDSTGTGGNAVYPIDADENTLYEDGSFGVTAGELVRVAQCNHNNTINDDYKYLVIEMSGTWQNTVLYVNQCYDTPTWEYILSVVQSAGGEIKAEYIEDSTTYGLPCVKLTIADYLTQNTIGSIVPTGDIELADNMISCVQNIAPNDLITLLTIRADSYTLLSTTQGGVEYNKQARITMQDLASALQTNYTTWLNDVLTEFNARSWKPGVMHNFINVYATDEVIGEFNALDEYGGIRGTLAINGVFDTSGWNDDGPYQNIRGWLADNVTEDQFKRLLQLALRYFDSHDKITPSITVSAADVALIDNVNYESLELYTWWTVTNSLLNLNDVFEIVEIAWSQGQEHVPSITLGSKPILAVDTGIHIRKQPEVKNGENSSVSGAMSNTSGGSSNGGSGHEYTNNTYGNKDITNPYKTETVGGDGWKHEVVTSVPAQPANKTIYFVK